MCGCKELTAQMPLRKLPKIGLDTVWRSLLRSVMDLASLIESAGAAPRLLTRVAMLWELLPTISLRSMSDHCNLFMKCIFQLCISLLAT